MNVSALLPQAHQPARPKNVVTSNGKGCDICGDNARFTSTCKTRGNSDGGLSERRIGGGLIAGNGCVSLCRSARRQRRLSKVVHLASDQPGEGLHAKFGSGVTEPPEPPCATTPLLAGAVCGSGPCSPDTWSCLPYEGLL